MIRLGLDTSTSLGSVALARDEELLAESLLSVRAVRSESVLPEVERLLTATGHARGDLSEVVVGSGPGSFTGVRIAASLAKGLCFEREVALYAYSSLLCAAAGTGLAGNVCALFDARRGEVYAAAYRCVVPPEPELGPSAMPVARLLDRLVPAEWAFVGEGARLHREAIRAGGGRVLPPPTAPPRASTLLWLAGVCPAEGRVVAPSDWEPEYVRRSGATRGRRAGSPSTP